MKDHEFEFLVIEYQKVNSQLHQWLDTDQKEIDVALVAISAVVVAASFAIDQTAFVLLLLLALPFHLLIWAQARKSIIVHHLSHYMREGIIPKLSKHFRSLQAGSMKGNAQQSLIWEEYVATISKGFSITSLALGLPHIGKMILHSSIAFTLVVYYFVLRTNNIQYTISMFDNILLIVQIIASIASLLAMYATLRLRKQLGDFKDS